MRKILSILILFAIVFNSFIFFVIQPGWEKASAQVSLPKGSAGIEVSASVGEFYLRISGFISPFASLVLTLPDGTFLRSGVADAGGNFYISDVLIKKGFSGFCLIAVDFNRLGESTTCFSFPPATSSITMRDLFLPPTLGLSRNQIAAGATAIAFGYTMPGAIVTLHLSNGKTLTTVADGSGYYIFRIENLQAGKYDLFSTAKYKEKESLSPTKKIQLTALSLWEQFLAFLKRIWDTVVGFFTSLSLGPLWLGLPILILIIILILKLWPERFTFMYESKFLKLIELPGKHDKKLHHWWFVGY